VHQPVAVPDIEIIMWHRPPPTELMLDTHKRSSANESALVGGSFKSSTVSYIEQRVVNRNVMLALSPPRLGIYR
jgi:hypothetical protein